MTKKTDRRK
jgi:hypothetical protein